LDFFNLDFQFCPPALGKDTYLKWMRRN